MTTSTSLLYTVLILGLGCGLALYRALTWLIHPSWVGWLGVVLIVGCAVALMRRRAGP